MKQRTILILLSVLLTIACLFASCNADKSMLPDSDDRQPATDQASNIQALENQILALQQNQEISEIERQKELERLQNLLTQLKEENNAKPNDATQNTAVGKFLYNLDGEYAIITGYTGTEEQIVIPSMIDGYTVLEIADNAFSSKHLKSVIVTSGVKKIGWFSFQNCSNLSSVTLPSSIESIGYSAFPSQNKNFTIYSPINSFAQRYAQSYGISHATV